MIARRAYEGVPAYEVGRKEARLETICQIYEEYVPTVLNMLALISETSEDESSVELANDAYNYINSVVCEALPKVYVTDKVSEETEIELPEVE